MSTSEIPSYSEILSNRKKHFDIEADNFRRDKFKETGGLDDQDYITGRPYRWEEIAITGMCEGMGHNKAHEHNNRAFYTPSETLLSVEHVKLLEKKTGISEFPDEFYKYVCTIPLALTKHLLTFCGQRYMSGLEQVKYFGGLGFSDKDGNISQYRPPVPFPLGETTAKYLTICPEVVGEDWEKQKLGVKPVLIEGINKKEKTKKVLVVTEGYSKGFSIAYNGFDTTVLTGVTMWNTDAARNFFLSIVNNYDQIVLAFDIDFKTNKKVKKQLLKFAASYRAKVADWSETNPNAKGFDDLMVERGEDDTKFLRGVILEAKALETGYFIENKDNPYLDMAEVIATHYPGLYFDGSYWVNDGDIISVNQANRLLMGEIGQFYTMTKNGERNIWGTKFKEALLYIQTCLTKEGSTSAFFMANGSYNKGVFSPYNDGETDPRANKWSYNPELDDPEELIEFLQKCHGNLNYRYWLRSVFDNQIQYGAILGVTGKSGSGKSVTLSIVKKLLRSLDQKDTQLTQLDKPERLAGLGDPRILMQSDCQYMPNDLTLIYMLVGAEAIDVRYLYQTAMTKKTFYTRMAMGFVTLPYIDDINGGFARRFKSITCKRYQGMGSDVAKLMELMDDEKYQERVANWALKADLEKTIEFMLINEEGKIGMETTSSPIYQFLDKVLIDKEATVEHPLEELYDCYLLDCNKKQRKGVSLTKFKAFLVRLEIPMSQPIKYRDSEGRLAVSPEVVTIQVDGRAISALERGDSFRHINNHYFMVRDDVKRDDDVLQLVVEIKDGEETQEILDNGTAILINPDEELFQKYSTAQKTTIIRHGASEIPLWVSRLKVKIKSAQ